jgi:DNA-binding NtrC family response regulator
VSPFKSLLFFKLFLVNKYSTHKFVAIVYDELDLVLLFKDALSGVRGIDAVGFTVPSLALQHLFTNQAKYEAVISDFRMPEMNGVELLKKIKAVNSNVKTLLISAFGINDNVFREISCVDKVLQKPIHISELMNEVGMTVL